jgi:hypothetical protein
MLTFRITSQAIDDARISTLSKEIDDMKSRNTDLEADYNRLVERRKALVLQ